MPTSNRAQKKYRRTQERELTSIYRTEILMWCTDSTTPRKNKFGHFTSVRIQNRNSVTHIKGLALGSPNAQDRPSRKIRKTNKKASSRHQNTICNQSRVLTRVQKSNKRGKNFHETSGCHEGNLSKNQSRIPAANITRSIDRTLTRYEGRTRINTSH